MASKFAVTFDTDNDAFHPEPGPEIVSILKGVIARIENGESGGYIRDTNGNAIGAWSMPAAQ